jgi:hypothetical protein
MYCASFLILTSQTPDLAFDSWILVATLCFRLFVEYGRISIPLISVGLRLQIHRSSISGTPSSPMIW